jgi:hypothetical protein
VLDIDFINSIIISGSSNRTLQRNELTHINKKIYPKKFCNGCLRVLHSYEFGKNKCKPGGIRNKCNTCRQEQRSLFRNKDNRKFIQRENTQEYKEKQFASTLKRRYGIDLLDFDKMMEEQNGKCAVCRQEEKHSTKTKLSVDHSHFTKKVRGLLCHRCNVFIGLAKEDIYVLERAIKYLKEEK